MTRTAATFEFEGEQLTVAQIRERVPILTDHCIRDHLKAGRNTVQAMLSYCRSHPSWANGRKASKAARAAGRVPSYRSSDRS